MLMEVPGTEREMLIAFAQAGIDVRRLVVESLRPMSSLLRQLKRRGVRMVLDENGKFVAMHRDSVKTVMRFIDQDGVEHVLYEIGRIYQMPGLKYPHNCDLKRRTYSLSGTREMILGTDGIWRSEHPFVTVHRETLEELKVDIDALGAVLTEIPSPAEEKAEPKGHLSSIYKIPAIENKTFVDCLLATCPPELRWPQVADDDFTFVMFEWSPPFERRHSGGSAYADST